jgi:tetratricopeptide (TPR) repeat protein
MTGAPRSRLMASLDEAIKKAANPIEAQCLRAERAALLARQGQLERAQAVIDELKAQIAFTPHNALVRGWVALADGLHGHYSVIDGGGREGIEMAWRLAGDAGAAGRRLRATAAAWLAGLSYNTEEDPARVGALVRQAIDTAAPEHHGARARATLVAGFAYHYAGRSDRAHGWYEASRRHGIADGDEAHLSALMHNQAWQRAALAQTAALFDDAGGVEPLTQALMSAESIGHYDAGIGTASLASLVPMLRAQLLTAQGRHEEALQLFDAHFDAAMAEGLKRLAASLLADRAWCEQRMGRSDAARTLAAAADAALAEPIDFDDRMVALARLAQVRDALGQTAIAAALREQAQALHRQYLVQQAQMAAALDAALVGLEPKAL